MIGFVLCIRVHAAPVDCLCHSDVYLIVVLDWPGGLAVSALPS